METCGPGRCPLWFRNLACATLAFRATAFHRWLALALVLRNYAHALELLPLDAPTRFMYELMHAWHPVVGEEAEDGLRSLFEGTLSVGARPAAG